MKFLKSLISPHAFRYIFSLLLFLGFSAQAGVFLKIDGVDGESTDNNHKNWINLLSVSSGVNRSSSTSTGGSKGSGGTKAIFSDINVVKNLDRTSPTLRGALAQGQVFPTATIHITKQCDPGNQAVYFKYELDNVVVTSISISGDASSNEVPVENLSLNFEKVTWTYTELDNNCTKNKETSASWNIKTNTP